jgi:hypothetical protein
MIQTSETIKLTSELVAALSDLASAQRRINAVLGALGSGSPPTPSRVSAAVRTTSTQILAVLSAAGEPLTLIDIADGVVALRRGEDEPRKGGGTRYQELARSSLARLVERNLVRRVPPAAKNELMKFERVT